MRSVLVVLTVMAVPSVALFFGGGGGDCGCNSCCSPPPPPCPPPPPPCPPPPPPCPPPQPCGCGGGGGYAAPSYGGSSYAGLPPCPPKYVIVRPAETIGGAVGPVGSAGISGGASSGYNAGPVAPIGSSAQTGVAAEASEAAGTASAGSYGESSQQNVAASSSAAAGSDYSESEAASSKYAPPANPREYAAKTIVDALKCRNPELQQLMEEQMNESDASESKRRVHKAANAAFPADVANNEKEIDVFCAPTKIAYRLFAEMSCEHTKGEVTCVAYRQAF